MSWVVSDEDREQVKYWWDMWQQTNSAIAEFEIIKIIAKVLELDG